MTSWRHPWSTEAMLESSRLMAEPLTMFNRAWGSLWADAVTAARPKTSWPPAGVWLPPADVKPPPSESVNVAPRSIPTSPVTKRARTRRQAGRRT